MKPFAGFEAKILTAFTAAVLVVAGLTAANWTLQRNASEAAVWVDHTREVLDYLVEPAFASTFTVLPENLSKAFLLSTVATMFRGFHLQAFHARELRLRISRIGRRKLRQLRQLV